MTRGLDVTRAFNRAHRQRYGYAQEANQVEIVSARLRSKGAVEKLTTERANPVASKSDKGRNVSPRGVTFLRNIASPRDYVKVYFSRVATRTALYARDELGAGAQLKTPCIVTEYSSTTLIPPGALASIDAGGNLIIKP